MSLRLEKLARKAFGAINKDKEILKIFWEGLKLEIRKLIISANPVTLKEALEIAQKAEKLLVGFNNTKEINTVTDISTNATSQRRSRQLSRSPSPHRNNKQERSNTPYLRQSSPAKKCFNCGKVGHIAKVCRNRKDTANKDLEHIKCYKCGKPGHYSSNCYSKNY